MENKTWLGLRFCLMFQKSEKFWGIFKANFGGNLRILGLKKLFGNFANFHPMNKDKLYEVFDNFFMKLTF